MFSPTHVLIYSPRFSRQARQLVAVCDSKLLSSAILNFATARSELSQRSTPSPSSSSLSPSSRSPSRSPSHHPPTSPSRAAISPSRYSAPLEGSEGSKSKRASTQADLHEEEWVRQKDSYLVLVPVLCLSVLCVHTGEGLAKR